MTRRSRTIRVATIGGAPAPATESEVVALRESTITVLAGRGLLCADQVVAAHRFRNYWADAHHARQRSAGFEEFVSGARGEPVSERGAIAVSELRRARLLVGRDGFNLLGTVCGDGHAISYSTRRQHDFAIDCIRRDLTALSQLWGIDLRTD